MSDLQRQDIDFLNIFKKLGHQLEEIRIRALDNILLKLEHKLICDADIVNERFMFIQLLNWFNYENAPKQKEVLGLLKQLSQSTSAAEVLQDIGGIEFLSELRKDLPSSLQPVLDQIIENVMRLPDLHRNEHAAECIYSKPTHTSIVSSGYVESISDHGTIYDTNSHPSSTVTKSSVEQDGNNGFIETPIGYFSDQITDHGDLREVPVQNGGVVDGFKMSSFPWLSLTPADRQVLSSTNSSLQNKEPTLLISSCDFLSDVVFHDFPAEIFLQRPNLVKSLLSLLTDVSDGTFNIIIHVSRTLADLTRILHSRINYYQDPALYTPKRDYGSSVATSSTQSGYSSDNSSVGISDTRRRGDGREFDSSASSSRASSAKFDGYFSNHKEETDIEDTQALQFMQLTIPQYCLLVLEAAIPLLKLSNEQVIIEVLTLLNETLNVMHEVIAPGIWEDSTASSRETGEKITEVLERTWNVIQTVHHYSSGSTNVLKRLVFIGIGNFLSRLLWYFIPIDKSHIAIPENLFAGLDNYMFDKNFYVNSPDAHLMLSKFLDHLSSERSKIYQNVSHITLSMDSTCKFLLLSQKNADPAALLSLAEESLDSVYFHQHKLFITEAVKLSSNLCSKTSVEAAHKQRSQAIVLKLLAYPSQTVKLLTYKIILQRCQESLNVNLAAGNMKNKSHYLTRFLFNADILYEISCFGLNDKDKNISNMASQLLNHLLQSQLLMGEKHWSEFQNSLLRSLPLLQSYIGSTEIISDKLETMLKPSADKSTGQLTKFEKFRGTLRLLFSPTKRVRVSALKNLMWFLSNETNSENKEVLFKTDSANIADFLVTFAPRSLDEEDLGKSIFKEDGLKQVYEIFCSKSVDASVKKSAMEQMSIIMQDPRLHSCFISLNAQASMTDILEKNTAKSPDQTVQGLLLPCLRVLRNLLHFNNSLKRDLSYVEDLHYNLLRVALQYNTDKEICYEVAHILFLLLFSEVSKMEIRSTNSYGQVSVPALVKERFSLPFKPLTHHVTSPNCSELTYELEPLETGAAAEMLRIHWNIAWHNGVGELIKYLVKDQMSADMEKKEFSEKLLLTAEDKSLILMSNLTHGLQQGVYDVSNATSHVYVKKALSKLLLYISVFCHSDVPKDFNSLNWWNSLNRFLRIVPSSTADEVLLQDVLHFICVALKLSENIPEPLIKQLGDLLYDDSGPLIALLNRNVAGDNVDDENVLSMKRSLDKELLSFISTYNSSLPYSLHTRLKIEQFRGDLSRKLLLRLNVADAPHFYNLASLEGTLQCLMHITARPGWSCECKDVNSEALCSQVLNCLLEVVSAFHIGRGGASMSYMGKGVTKAATLCLRHIAFEMSTQVEDKDWPKNWLYSKQGTDAVGEPGLNWLLNLWAYRDPEVRAAGLGITVALTSVEAGRVMVTANCKHIPGGIWGLAFSILLDQADCSMVRQQAALLLVNLTSQSMPSGTVELTQTSWQGPVVTDTEYQVTMVGLSALLALLHHSEFYQEMLILMSNFYSNITIHPISRVADTNPNSNCNSGSTTLSVLGDTTPLAIGRTGISSTISSPRHITSTPNQNQKDVLFVGSVSSKSTTPHSAHNTTQTEEMSGNNSIIYHSVATPSLISAVSQLLDNIVTLAPDDAFMSFKKYSIIPVIFKLLDINMLEEYEIASEVLTSGDILQLVFGDLLNMFGNIMQLLTTCVENDSQIRNDILTDSDILYSLLSALKIRAKGCDELKGDCQTLWALTMNLCVKLLSCQASQSSLQIFTPVVSKLWPTVSDCVTEVLTTLTSDAEELRTTCLKFLGVIFSEEGKFQVKYGYKTDTQMPTVTDLLESKKSGHTETTGAILSKILINKYEMFCLSSLNASKFCEEKIYLVSCLKCLLAISDSAKTAGLNMGLVENTMEHIKQINSQLNLESIQIGKPIQRKKDDPLINDLIQTFDVLRNLMFQKEDVKVSCYHSGLPNIIHRLWAWCQLDSSLMTAAVSLLTTYVAGCPTACSSLAFTSPTATVQSKSQLSQNSLVHALVKLAQKYNGKENQLKAIFHLLASLSLSTECRNIIWKSNFLGDFSQLNPKKGSKTKSKQKQETLWLELIQNMSFSIEGQNMILKIQDSTELLLEFIETGQYQDTALLILRNLCCHTSNKPKLLTCDKLVPMFVQCLFSQKETVQTLASSALWALLYNHQKAKVSLKNANISPRLQEVINNITNTPGMKSTEQLKSMKNIQQVLDLLAE